MAVGSCTILISRMPDCEVCIILACHPERLCGADGDDLKARLSVHAGEFCQSVPPKVLSEGINLRVLLACKSAERRAVLPCGR